MKKQCFVVPKSKFVRRVKNSIAPIVSSISLFDGREGLSPLDSDIVCENDETFTSDCKKAEIFDQESSDPILKPLSLASLVDLEEGSY